MQYRLNFRKVKFMDISKIQFGELTKNISINDKNALQDELTQKTDNNDITEMIKNIQNATDEEEEVIIIDDIDDFLKTGSSKTSKNSTTETNVDLASNTTQAITQKYNKTYVNGKIANGIVNGIYYKKGKAYTGKLDDVYYQNGIPYSGERNKTIYQNGIKYTGFDEESNTYYKEGKAYATIKDGICYKNNKAYTGAIGNNYYDNGELVTATINGKYYENGVLFTGYKDDIYYQNGQKYTGVANNQYYKNGQLATGTANNKYYENGELYSGIKDNYLYKDGEKYTGIDEETGMYYKNGKLGSGTSATGAEYKNGAIYSGTVDGVTYIKGKIYNGTVDNVTYKNGLVYTGTVNNVTYKDGIIENNTLQINGLFDESFNQGKTGDCWAIAGLIALNASEAGKEIIKNAISMDADGNVLITFEGAATTIKVTKQEIEKYDRSSSFTSGDNDVLAFEIAVAKLRGSRNSEKETLSEAARGGGNSEMIKYIMNTSGKNTTYSTYNTTKKQESLTSIYNNYTKDNGNAAITFALTGGEHTATCTDGSTFKIKLSGAHALAITNITEDTVTIVNPWSSETSYTMTWDEFSKLKLDNAITYTSLSD